MERNNTLFVSNKCSPEFRQKMKKWGVIKEEEESKVNLTLETPSKRFVMFSNQNGFAPFVCIDQTLMPTAIVSDFFSNGWITHGYINQNIGNLSPIERQLQKQVNALSSQCRYFAQKIKEFEGQRSPKAKKLRSSDVIYEENKAQLEQKCFGKIVAIDNDEHNIVGFGDTLLDAYNDAKSKSKKTKFSYKRIGYTDRM
jgi:hypothetical protein